MKERYMAFFCGCLLLLATARLHGQKQPLSYFLPDIGYDEKIPTPEEWLGYQIGEWHISHDQQYGYMRQLASLSPRAKLVEHGRSYENRPLIHLIITSEENHRNLESIREQHVALTDPAHSAKAAISEMPLVIYQGFSIHGNESSGANAAPLVAYYLLAGQSPEIEELLDKVVIIFDPSFNPDGLTRFSTWANMHKNRHLTSDSQDREYGEVWPGGRYNHYWFDLNRDWLTGAHPESRGRIELFHRWKPNILTDHHEMGTNSTFFFMPGVSTRVNPITPAKNQELTAKIGQYHAKALDAIGSLYYSAEGYDDFYYGKGSTFPDANGCIGILFEQASSRGHLQESDNGLLSFAFTIRNQVATALSTQAAAVGLREELLQHQRDFFQSAQREARADDRKAFVFGDPYDIARTDQLVEVLRRQEVEVYQLGKNISADGHDFAPGTAFVVPMEQKQYRLIRGMFETMTEFEDSIFYDISSWTLPLAFNVPYAALNARAMDKSVLGAPVSGLRPQRAAQPTPSQSLYAYLFTWDEYYAPKAMYHILSGEVRAKVSTRPLTLNGVSYPPGTIMIPVYNQRQSPAEIHRIVAEAAAASGVKIESVATGLTPQGIDLGSNDFEVVEMPRVAVLVGSGMSPGTAGEAWHLLDQRYGIPVTKLELDDLGRADLSKYTVIVVGAIYGSAGGSGADNLKQFVQRGGTVIGIQSGVSWLQRQGIGYAEVRKEQEDPTALRRPYAQMDADRRVREVPGTIFAAELDLSHPLAFGFRRSRISVFRDGDLFMETGKNPYSTPLVYTDQPLISGYLNGRYVDLVKETVGIVVSGLGGGRVIFMADNPNFRAHWWGTNKLFANAIFFGDIVSSRATEPAPRRD